MNNNQVSFLIEQCLVEDIDSELNIAPEGEFPESRNPDETLADTLDPFSEVGIEDLVTQEDIANKEKIGKKYIEVFVSAYEQIKKLSEIINMLKDPYYNKDDVNSRNLTQNIALLTKLKPEEKANLANNDKMIKKAANAISEVITNFDSIASSDKDLADAITADSKVSSGMERDTSNDRGYEDMFIN